MSSNLTASAILDIFLSIENEMRDLIDSSLFYFQIQRIPQKPSETFYGVVSDGLIPLKFPQIPKVPPRHLGIWGIFAKVFAFLIFTVNGIFLPITNAEFLLDHGEAFSMPTRSCILPQSHMLPYRLK